MKWGEFKKMVESLDGKDDQEIEIHCNELTVYGYSWLRKFQVKKVIMMPVDKTIVIECEEEGKKREKNF